MSEVRKIDQIMELAMVRYGVKSRSEVYPYVVGMLSAVMNDIQADALIESLNETIAEKEKN